MPQTEDQSIRDDARKRLEKRLQRSEVQHNKAHTQKQAPPETSPQTSTGTQAQETARTFSLAHIATGLLETYGIRFIIAVVVAVVVVAYLLGSGLRSCTHALENEHATSSPTSAASTKSSSSSANSAQTQPATNAPENEQRSNTNTQFVAHVIQTTRTQLEDAKAQAEQNDIRNYLEEDLVKQITIQAKTNKETRWIATHPSAYAIDGWAVQYKILKLAAEEPLACRYVRDWPESYPQTTQDLSNKNAYETTPTGPHNIPLLFQWDPRWGYTVYSSTAFGMTGCCPTAFAMVYQGLSGKNDLSPYDMGLRAQEGGYMSLYEGTDANFLVNEAPGLGLNCWILDDTSYALTAALEAGQVVIANVGPGDFTNDGHFIVITGIKDGKLIVNDPYSKVRSSKLWEPDEIIIQTKALFAYSKA